MSATKLVDTRRLVYVCMTHVPLWVRFPSYVTTLYLGHAQGPGKLNARELAPEWDPYWPVLGAEVGTFGLRNYLLKDRPDATHVGICQYRKFVSRRRVGVSAQNYQVMDVVSKANTVTLPLDDLMSAEKMPLMIGRPANLDGSGKADYLSQYAGSHLVEDFLRFTAEAVELGVLPRNAVHSFFSEKIFFPGGIELGVFPVDFWIPAVTAMEKVARACVERFAAREAPQNRAWAFCIERLGSWMLLEYLRTEVWGNDWSLIGGHLNLITEDETKTYVPGT